jgi:hypothetical protein
MNGDPVAAAIAYASSPEGSAERRRHFEAFAGHFRGRDGAVDIPRMEGWLAGRTAAVQAAAAPAPSAPAAQLAQPGRVSDADYARMTGAERFDYAQRFDQSKMPAWRDPRTQGA